MTRIFTTLAFLSLGLFLAAIIIGLTIGDLYERNDIEALKDTMQVRGVHMLTGVASALMVVLVHSIVATYFIGTSRWCKEVTETYALGPEPLRKSTHLKRKTFPWCVMGMLAVVGVGALGAASDPGTGREGTAMMANYHLVGSFAGFVFVAWTYFRAWVNITDNQLVIEEIVEQVRQIRQERGLDTEPVSQQEQAMAASH